MAVTPRPASSRLLLTDRLQGAAHRLGLGACAPVMATTSTHRRSRSWAASSAARAAVAESDSASARAVGNLGIGGLRETEPSLSPGLMRGATAQSRSRLNESRTGAATT
jgi:hypothetical protein